MKEDRAASRFTEPTGFNSPKQAPAIDGIKPGDKGYAEAWCKKNGIPYEKVETSD